MFEPDSALCINFVLLTKISIFIVPCQAFAVHPTTEAELRASGRFEPIVADTHAVSFLRSQTGGALTDKVGKEGGEASAGKSEPEIVISNVYSQGGDEH